MNLARFTRVYSVTDLSFGNVPDPVHSVTSQNETPHFGIPNLLHNSTAETKTSRSLFTVRTHFRYRNCG
jgi:hypothetical protein